MELIDAALKISQAGAVPILVLIILALGWACKTLFEAYRGVSERAIVALEASAKALEAHTRAIQESNRVSEASTAATEAITEAFQSVVTKGRSS